MNYAELIIETEEELKESENCQKLVQFQKRIRFLRLLKTGAAKTQKQAGEMVGWQLRNAQKIWQLYRRQRLDAVVRENKHWYFGKLSSRELAQLQNYLAMFGAADLAQVQAVIQTRFNVSYTVGGVSAVCRRLKIKLKTARPVNAKKDAERAVAYKKTLER